MSEFKFSCSSCGQRIAATDEHIGYQINCPACQATIVVPANPAAQAARATSSRISAGVPPGMPPPPTPPAQGRLVVSALSSPQGGAPASGSRLNPMQGSARFEALQARKAKKSHTGLIAGVSAVVVIGVAAFFCRGWITAKWNNYRGTPAAEEAATNQPPPPPPELTVEEIWQHVGAAYKGLPSLSATGKSVTVLDMSQANPAAAGAGTQSLPADLTIKLGRPDNYRVDVDQQLGPATMSSVGWSAGKGDFLMVNNKRMKEPSSGPVLSGMGAGGAAMMANLFFHSGGEVPSYAGMGWSRTNGAPIPGQPCYVLVGTMVLRPTLIWVSKKTFLIHQLQVVLEGKTNAVDMDDAKIKEALMAANDGQPVTPAQITQFKATMKAMSKIKGTITDTFKDFQTNASLAISDFEPAPSGAAPAAQPRGGGAGGGIGGGAPPGGAARRRPGG